jgi:myo-inositol-1(or 4)-monophosphatase
MHAVDQAAELVRRSAPGHLTAKGDRDYATELDYTVERTVRKFLAEAAPGIGFVGKEEGRAGADGGLWWTLDPIAGTVNLAHAMPLCAVSLALVENERPVLGVIELPLLGSRYHAVEGHRAWKDGTRLHVSDTTTLAEEKNRVRLAVTEKLAARALRVRMLGSAAIDLAWLAEGRLDASITLSNLSWDVAAGVVVARESGAEVRDGDSSNCTLHAVEAIAAPERLMPESNPFFQSGIDTPPRWIAKDPVNRPLDMLLTRSACSVPPRLGADGRKPERLPAQHRPLLSFQSVSVPLRRLSRSRSGSPSCHRRVSPAADSMRRQNIGANGRQ